MVRLLFSWRFIGILKYEQTVCVKLLNENCFCTLDTAHHGSDKRILHIIGFLKEKCRVYNLCLPSISKVKLIILGYLEILQRCQIWVEACAQWI